MGSLGVVGSGLAGLTTAIRAKILVPDLSVMVLEKKHRESNTQISGMRFRERLPGKPVNPSDLTQLLSSRNEGEVTPEMQAFSTQIQDELAFWANLHQEVSDIYPLPTTNETSWFGPQWAAGRGLDALRWLQTVAKHLGIEMVQGEALALQRQGKRMESVLFTESETGKTLSLNADSFVLANGSVGGSLFYSTNKEIRHSAQELAFQSHLPLVGSTTHMIHPFGRALPDGTPTLGCYATDDLHGFRVQYPDGEIDHEVTAMLDSHTAHDFFPAIARKFWEKGGVVQLISPEGERHWARVSHHYSQCGIETSDTVAVMGMENMWVAGDAGGWRLSNYATRFPGFGLSKCLVDAYAISESLAEKTRGGGAVEITPYTEHLIPGLMSKQEKTELKRLNTRFLLQHIFDEGSLRSGEWESALNRLAGDHPLIEMSKELSVAHDLKREGKIREPYPLTSPEGVIISEAQREVSLFRDKERR